MRLACLFALTATAAVPAQLTWTRLTPPTAPPGGEASQMVATTNPPELLLFGGTPTAETWRYATGGWTRLSPPTTPPARTRHAMAFDAARGRVVVFGGYTRGISQPLQDTWEWDGATWTRVPTPTTPPARWGAAMTFDPSLGRVVMHGGFGTVYFGDTWTYDGRDWTRLAQPYEPGPRTEAAMAGHPTEGIVLFGGVDAFSELDDVWVLRGGVWSRLARVPGPAPRYGHSLTYDPDRRRFVMHGGERRGPGFFDDTWEFATAGGWTQAAPVVAGPALTQHAAAYDAQARRTVVFGGSQWVTTPGGAARTPSADTWTYGGTALATVTRIGNGCGGSIDLLFSSPPILGSAGFSFRAMPPVAVPLLPPVAGLAPARLPTPLPLGPCELHLGAPISLWNADNRLVSSFTLPIPNDPALRGARVFVQVFDTERSRGSGWNGLAFSPAYELVLGD